MNESIKWLHCLVAKDAGALPWYSSWATGIPSRRHAIGSTLYHSVVYQILCMLCLLEPEFLDRMNAMPRKLLAGLPVFSPMWLLWTCGEPPDHLCALSFAEQWWCQLMYTYVYVYLFFGRAVFLSNMKYGLLHLWPRLCHDTTSCCDGHSHRQDKTGGVGFMVK